MKSTKIVLWEIVVAYIVFCLISPSVAIVENFTQSLQFRNNETVGIVKVYSSYGHAGQDIVIGSNIEPTLYQYSLSSLYAYDLGDASGYGTKREAFYHGLQGNYGGLYGYNSRLGTLKHYATIGSITGQYGIDTTEAVYVLTCPRGTFLSQFSPSSSISSSWNLGINGFPDEEAACFPCHIGYSCEGFSGAIECIAGQFCNYMSAGINILPGYFSSSTGLMTDAQRTICPAGSYCEEGSSSSTSCPAGYLCSPATTSSTRYPSPPGKTSVASRSLHSDLVSCVSGKYCYAGSVSTDLTNNCPAGTYNSYSGAGSLLECTFCPSGKRCLCEGQTSHSYDPSACTTTTITDTDCPAGYYCPTGSAEPIECPAGTYRTSSSTSAGDVTDCLPCSAGYACPEASTADQVEPCDAGHYCPEGTRYSFEYPCPPGTYYSGTDATSKNDCNTCTTGYCSEGSTSEAACPQGYSCSNGEKTPCPGGQKSANGDLTCSDCIAGETCPADNYESNPIECSPGTYMSGTASSAEECTKCPDGYFCPSAGSTTTGTPCSDGKWTPEGSTSCNEDCPAGYYCISGSKSSCPATYYCQVGTDSATPTTICPAGYYCPIGTSEPLVCEPGTYSTAQASSCSSVASPYYSHQGEDAQTELCAAGYACDTGATGSVSSPCEAGTYKATGTSSCSECTAGNYCPGGGNPVQIVCPRGHYCEDGCSSPVKCPTGTFRDTPGAISEANCVQCTGGFACTQVGLVEPDLECDAGYYCPGGQDTTQPSTYICPIGSYCESGVDDFAPCPEGTYNSFTGSKYASECIDCPEGFYCEGSGTAGPTAVCIVGHYCEEEETLTTMNTKITNAGYHAPQGQAAQIPCLKGNYSDATSQKYCSVCNAGDYCIGKTESSPSQCTTGHYCIAGTVNPLECPEGTYRSTLGATMIEECTYCDEGFACPGFARTSIGDTCLAGYFCSKGSFSTTPHYLYEEDSTLWFGPCQAGKYCSAGASTQTDCDAGSFSNSIGLTAQSECLPCTPGKYCDTAGATIEAGACTAGYYCPGGDDSATSVICPIGHYCPTGSAFPIPCEAGTYQANEGHSTCDTCPEGKYCLIECSAPVDCPKGYYCLAGTTFEYEHPCSPGTYNNALSQVDSSGCLDCTAGNYCPTYGMVTPIIDCDAGFYCLTSSKYPNPPDILMGGLCTSSHICPAGSIEEQNCPENYYCDREGMSIEDNTRICFDGFECGVENSDPTPTYTEAVNANHHYCPEGYYCQGGDKTACTAGYYLPTIGKGQNGISDCLTCPYGYFCDSDAQGSLTSANYCPAGYYCTSGQTSGTANQCPVGYYCAGGNTQFDKIQCEPGYFSDSDGATSCTICSAGNFCEFSDTSGTPAMTPCPAGHYCPDNGMDAPLPCEPGTYQASTGQTSCDDCEAGYYCDKSGMTEQILCTAGFYCEAKCTEEKPDNYMCSRGSYCPQGSSSMTPCTAGKYCPDYMMSAAGDDCFLGYYCNEGSTLPNPTDGIMGNVCPAGYYCDDKLAQHPCPIGTYLDYQGAKDSSECKECPAGQLCLTEALTNPLTNDCTAGVYCKEGEPDADCREGFKCPAGVYDEELCQPGTYQDETAQSVCKTCPEGYYCAFPDQNDPENNPIINPVICPKGYYCPEGADHYSYTPCPEGTYGGSTGLTDESECTICEETHYCAKKALIEVSGDCEDGYLCPSGSVTPMPCLGSGYSCADPNTEINPRRCTKNYYCAAGVETECPTSQFTYEQGAASAAECMNCLPGKLCSDHDNSVNSCPAGSFCVDGVETSCDAGYYCEAESSVQIKCPLGTYNNQAGQSSCTNCDEGKYCPSLGLTTMTECPADKICVTTDDMNEIYKPTPCEYGKTVASTTTCEECAAGKYCWPQAIGTGNEIGDCSAGYVCQGGSDSPTPIYAVQDMSDADSDFLTYNGQASKGYYTNTDTTANQKCLPGTYQNSRGATSCKDCPPGFYCPNEGMYSITGMECDAGYVCLEGSAVATPTDNTAGKECPDYYYCESGVSKERQCEDGKVPNTAKTECSTCSDDHFCNSHNAMVEEACASGNTNCINGQKFQPICPFGTYLSSDKSECASCPAGQYCVDGKAVEAGSFISSTSTSYSTDCEDGFCCAAGYLCTGGAYSPTPTSVGGSLCDVGYYCSSGAITLETCPSDKFRFSAGGRSESDCTDCHPGYLCIVGKTVPDSCPYGQYCPAGEETAINCHQGTYSDQLQNELFYDCDDCPAGYFCDSSSPITSLTDDLKCSAGKYCYEKALQENLCPFGTYRASSGAESIGDCISCPIGYSCGEGVREPNQCVDGELCEIGTSTPKPCPAGYYCTVENLCQKVLCPVNHYCPGKTSEPIVCSIGYTCPEGSKFPIKCLPGYRSIFEDDMYKCEVCPAGTYSETGTEENCSTCEAGYVCYGMTKYQYPTNAEYHYGEKCPKGHYCPAGSSEAKKCPIGTYNPYAQMADEEACLLCKDNTYNDVVGAEACMTCGNSASSTKGASTCTPIGKNRAFMKSDASARCMPGYEFIENSQTLTDENSDKDCQPIVYSRCHSDQVRNHLGECVDKNYCPHCSGGKGTRAEGTGICQCTETTSLDNICNRSCRQSYPQVLLGSDGNLKIYFPEDEENPVDVDYTDIPDFNFDYVESCPEDRINCTVKNVEIFADGKAYSRYGLGNSFASYYLELEGSRRFLSEKDKRRMLDDLSSSAVENPVFCIHEGDTFIFELNDNIHYPVYQKDSLLNTNSDFDYGAFKILDERMKSLVANDNSKFQYFGFTFSEGGTYVFADSLNTDILLIIKVASGTEECPDEESFVQTQTQEALATSGVKLDENLILEPDIIMLVLIMVSFLIGIGFILLLIKYFHYLAWKEKGGKGKILYREKQRKFNLSKIKFLFKKEEGKVQIATTENIVEGNIDSHRQLIDEKDKTMSIGLDELDDSFVSDDSEGVDLQKLEKLDPSIIENILSLYREYKNFLKNKMFVTCEKHSNKIEEMVKVFDKLKFLINERYEVLVRKLKLDIDFAKLSNVEVAMEEKEEVVQQVQAKPQIKLNKNELAKLQELQNGMNQNRANLKKEIYDQQEDWNEEAEENRKRKEKLLLQDKLNNFSDLSDLERRRLMDEYESDLLNVALILQSEKEQQEFELRRMIKQQRERRKRKGKLKQVPQEEGDEEDNPPADEIKMENLTEKEKEGIERIESKIEHEKEGLEKQMEMDKQQKIQNAKDEFLKTLTGQDPNSLSSEEKDSLLRKHEGELNNIMAAVEMDHQKQEAALMEKLEQRKKRLLRSCVKKRRSLIPINSVSKDSLGIDTQPSRISEKNLITVDEGEELDEREIKDVIESTISNPNMKNVLDENEKQLEKMRERHEMEKKNQETNHKGAQENVEEFEDREDFELEYEMKKREDDLKKEGKEKTSRIEEEKRRIKDQLLVSGKDKDEAARIQAAYAKKEELLKKVLEDQQKGQQSLLEERILRRKIGKMKRVSEIEHEQESERIKLEMQQEKERQKLISENEEAKIIEIIKQLKSEEADYKLGESHILEVFDNLILDKHAKEYGGELTRQFAEKEETLKNVLKKCADQKLIDKQSVKDKYKKLYENLNQKRHLMEEDDYEIEFKNLKVEEENDLKEVDVKSQMNQKKMEVNVRRELEDNHANEILNLKERQIREKAILMKKLFGLVEEDDREIRKELGRAKQQLQKEKEKKIKDIELDKKLVMEQFEKDLKERYNDYEQILLKQRETEKLLTQKKGNIQKMLKEKKNQLDQNLKNKSLISPEQQKELLEKYEKELMMLESTMEAERNRQFVSLREKIEQRKKLRERQLATEQKKMQFFVGTVGKNMSLQKAAPTEMIDEEDIIGKKIQQWKQNMHELERVDKPISFQTLNNFLENVNKFTEGEMDGIYLTIKDYEKYLRLLDLATKLEELLRKLRARGIQGTLADLQKIMKFFELLKSKIDEYDMRRGYTMRTGGGFQVFGDDEKLIMDLFSYQPKKKKQKNAGKKQ